MVDTAARGLSPKDLIGPTTAVVLDTLCLRPLLTSSEPVHSSGQLEVGHEADLPSLQRAKIPARSQLVTQLLTVAGLTLTATV